MPAHRTLIRSTCLALPVAVLAFVGHGMAAPPDAAELKREIAAAIEIHRLRGRGGSGGHPPLDGGLRERNAH